MSFMCQVVHDDRFQNYEELWEKIRVPVWNILKGIKTERKKKVESIMTIQKFRLNNEDLLYKKTSDLLREFCSECLQVISKDENPCRAIHEKFEEYHNTSAEMDKHFRQANETFIERCKYRRGWDYRPIDVKFVSEEDYTRISNLMNEVWAEVILERNDFLIKNIFKSTRCNKSDDSLMKQTIEFFDKIESHKREINRVLYENGLEKPMLQLLSDQYRAESSKLFALGITCSEYINKCSEMIELEKNYANEFFKKSVDVFINETWQRLVFDRRHFIRDGCREYIKNYDKKNLRTAYHLMKHKPDTFGLIVDEFVAFENSVFTKIRHTVKEEKFCDEMLETYTKEKKLVEEIFESNDDMTAAVDEALKKSLNEKVEEESENENANDGKPATNILEVPNFLINYCEQFLTNKTKVLDEKELESRLDGAIVLFKFLNHKDLFKKIYARSLAKRLMNSTSHSLEIEESMLVKLSDICGSDFVMKFRQMLTDVKLSSDIKTEFNKETPSIPYSFSILIMKNGSWPIQSCKMTFVAPMALERTMNAFNDFYKSRNVGRIFHWHQGLGTFELKTNYLEKSYVIETSYYITSILVIFNDRKTVPFSDIASITGISPKNLMKYLDHLVNKNILLCQDATSITKETDLCLNTQYNNERLRFKLMLQTDNFDEITPLQMNEDRTMYLQALIVRIMKAYRLMKHDDLVNEVIKESMSLFVPSKVFIKSNIDELVNKEYIKNEDAEERQYRYIA